jgi:hypothetical protein
MGGAKVCTLGGGADNFVTISPVGLYYIEAFSLWSRNFLYREKEKFTSLRVKHNEWKLIIISVK